MSLDPPKISISRYQIKHIPGTVKYFLQKLRDFPASKWLLEVFYFQQEWTAPLQMFVDFRMREFLME